MRYISERERIKQGIESFMATYSGGMYGEEWKNVSKVLKNFDPETVTKEEVDRTIGDTSWTEHKCSECGDYYSEIFMLGEEPDYESNTAYLCRGCMQEAINLCNSVEK